MLGDNNTAVARGNDSHALSGGTIAPDERDDNTNNLIAVGGGTVVRGSNNAATVRGNNSRALAGGPAVDLVRAFAGTARAVAVSLDNNRASVRGNDSRAVAGPGSDSRARVVGDGSSATARDGQRVISRGNGVHNPPRETETQY